MAAAAARKLANDTEAEQRKLARERLELMSEHRSTFDRLASIDVSLKAIAKTAGKGFRETFDGLGYVTVAPPKDGGTDGMHPEVNEPAYYALPDDAARGLSRAKLKEAGIITEKLRETRAYYGSVRAKLVGQESEG